MDYFPLFANLRAKRCLVVGGGDVAARKIRLLRQAKADVLVVAPKANEEVRRLANNNEITYVARKFSPNFLDGVILVIAATDQAQVNAQIFSLANERNMLCNSVDDAKNSSFITPAIVDRSPLVIAISSGGAAPVLARMIREKLEREIPKHYAKLAQIASSWRGRVKQALSSLTMRRRFWEELFDRFVTEGGGDSEQVNLRVSSLLKLHRNGEASQQGEAWLIGAGPGDPELLTIRAQQLLHKADVVLHDRLVSQSILEMARRDAEFINVGKPIAGTGCASCVQQDINQLLVELVAKGLRVARLKGGDPFIFGRGGEEITALQRAGLSFQIIPGITAAAACAAYAGIPLTHRDHAQSVVFVTGHGKNSQDNLDWPSLARDRQTLAVYMGVSRYAMISKRLRLHGRNADTPVAVIERGTTPQQRVITGRLADLDSIAKNHQIQAPALLIIGEVTKFAESQQWFNRGFQTKPFNYEVIHAVN